MRRFKFFVLSLFLVPVLGCGGSSETQTIDASELERYATENADAVARQEEIDAALEAQEEMDDEEDE